jgi:hypothetical protein
MDTKMKALGDLFVKGLDEISKAIENTDKKYGKLPPYKGGVKIGSYINNLIDDFSDFVLKKK